MLCVLTGASQPPADVDAAEHARRRFARRPESEKTREIVINNARQQTCAFGHWCAARHCMVNANSGTAIAGLIAVVPFGNGYVSSTIPPRGNLVCSNPGCRRWHRDMQMPLRSSRGARVGNDAKRVQNCAVHKNENCCLFDPTRAQDACVQRSMSLSCLLYQAVM